MIYNISMAKRKRVTAKQKNYVKEYIRNGENGTQAVLSTYNTKSARNASHIAMRNKKSPLVQQYMRKVLEKAGMTDDYIAEGLRKGFDAGTGEDALRKATLADSIRIAEMGYRLSDRFPATKKKIEKKTLTVTANMTTEQIVQTMKEKQQELNRFTKLMEDDVVDN